MNSFFSFFGYTSETEINPQFYTNYEINIKQGHAIDTIVKLALNNSEYMSLSDFTKITKIAPTKDIYNFCQSIYENIAIRIDTKMLPKFGFAGTIVAQKNQLFELLKKYKIPYQEVFQGETPIHNESKSNINSESDDEYAVPIIEDAFYWLIMPDDFRTLLLCLPNEVGDDIRAYYIRSDHVVRAYMTYQGKFIHKSQEQHRLLSAEHDLIKSQLNDMSAKYNKLNLQMDTLKREEVAMQKTVSLLSKKNKKLSVKNELLADNIEELNEYISDTGLTKFILVRLNDTDPDTYDYYMIYGSTKKANASYRRIHTKYPASERICTYKFAGEIKIYNIITDALGTNIICEGKYIAPKNTTPRGHTKFVKTIREILEDNS